MEEKVRVALEAEIHRLESCTTVVEVKRVAAALTCPVIYKRISAYSADDGKYTCAWSTL